MATKDYCLSFNNKKHETYGVNASNGQYSNLNLNQTKQCFSENTVITSKGGFSNESRKFDVKERTAALTKSLDTNDLQKKREFFSKDKHIKDLPSGFYESKKENHQKEFDYQKKAQNNNNNSTLSLHITAYENSVGNVAASNSMNGDENVALKKNKEEKGLIKNWKNTMNYSSDSAIKAAFELPRQQVGDKADNPEVMQFKTSRQLLNPNQAPLSGTASTDGNTTESRDKVVAASRKQSIKPKKADIERSKRLQAHQMQARATLKKQQYNREFSCVPQNARTRRGVDEPIDIQHGDAVEEKKLLDHLQKLTPFNARWEIAYVINSGSYGVVYAVKDIITKHPAVIKIAKATRNDTYVNDQAEWEAFLLMKIYKANQEASVCRLLDQGMLEDADGLPLEYMCLEYVGLRLHTHLDEYTGKDRQLRCCQISLMTLKGLYDIHKEGLLHRDLKPDNMGLISREQPVAIIFDLGMARMYTDASGKARIPRSMVGFRGTLEWASGHAAKGREQTRYDDLIAWFYSMIDLFHGNKDSNQVFPWSSRSKNSKEAQLFKSVFAPARYLLRKCPKSFFPINTYLQTASRQSAPDYGFIADRIKDAMEEVVPGSTADMSQMTKPLPPEKPLSGKPREGGIGSKENVDKKNV